MTGTRPHPPAVAVFDATSPIDQLRALGCSSHSCAIRPRGGVGTNGPCHCLDGLAPSDRTRIRVALSLWRRLAEGAR